MATARYILSIDQGTTSTRAILFDIEGQIVHSEQQEIQQYYPADGWVEHDAMEIWQKTLQVCRDALAAAASIDQVGAIGITNQRETTVVWDRATGEPIYPAIVWQDRRTADQCQSLKDAGHENDVTQWTGLLLDPYFSATKVRWILDHVEGARVKAEKGELAFGTIDSWLLWQLTGGTVHATDATNAARTLLFNLQENAWDERLLQLFEIPAAVLPKVMDCAADFGMTAPGIFERPLPITGIAGDQQAATIGQACFEPGMLKSTYGTGCFVLLNTGEKQVLSKNRLLSTVAYRINGKTTYALEGSIFVAGAAIQWLRDGLHLIESAGQTEALAKGAGEESGVYLVPAFTGLGAPYWDPRARGAIFGLTRDTGIADIVRAALEAVCYQTNDLLMALAADSGTEIRTLRVDGGMVANNWLLEFMASILNVRVERPTIIETTALGAAYLAGLQVGIYDSLESISHQWQRNASFEPAMTEQSRQQLLQGWQQAIDRVRTGS